MICPDTPKSVIAELLKDDNSPLRNKSWTTFFEIYYDIIRLMARKSLIKIGWTSLSEDDVSEITSNTFVSLEKAFSTGKYQPSDDRHFRGFLKRIVYCRAMDFIRAQSKHSVISVKALEIADAINKKDEPSEDFFQTWEDDEIRAYRFKKVYTIWETIRPAYSPITQQIFEMRILQNIPVMKICEELDVDRNKVDKAVHRLKSKLKEEFEKSDFGKEI